MKVADRYWGVTAAFDQLDLVVAWVVEVKSVVLESEIFLRKKITKVKDLQEYEVGLRGLIFLLKNNRFFL